MKIIITLALFTIAGLAAHAIPITLPLDCELTNEETSSPILTKISRDESGNIIAQVTDNSDLTNMACALFPDPVNARQKSLSCIGVWASDNSPATLTISMSFYVAMPTLQRSQGKHAGASISGVCSPRF